MIDSQKAGYVADILKLLANKQRLLILCALAEAPKNVGTVKECVPDISESALSQHLSHLRLAGVLESEKSGMNVIYRIKDEKILNVLITLKENYCNE